MRVRDAMHAAEQCAVASARITSIVCDHKEQSVIPQVVRLERGRYISYREVQRPQRVAVPVIPETSVERQLLPRWNILAVGPTVHGLHGHVQPQRFAGVALLDAFDGVFGVKVCRVLDLRDDIETRCLIVPHVVLNCPVGRTCVVLGVCSAFVALRSTEVSDVRSEAPVDE